MPVEGVADAPRQVLPVDDHEVQWSRLRVCANDECRSVFYDTTRSRTQRWHSYEICGNKRNVAAHRARTGSAKTDEQT